MARYIAHSRRCRPFWKRAGVQLLLIQRALRGPHGPTAEQAEIPISHRLFMSKVRRTQNGHVAAVSAKRRAIHGYRNVKTRDRTAWVVGKLMDISDENKRRVVRIV